MSTVRRARAATGWLRIVGVIGVTAMLIVAGSSSGSATEQRKFHVTLSAGAGAPGASGSATIGLVGSVAVGTARVHNLPAQPFGSGRFYGLWYVRSDDSKAFLGLLVSKESIIFSTGGSGEMRFSATQFTTGPAAGTPITFGPAGTNVLVLLIENLINGRTPSPIGPVPGTGVAVVGTF